MQHIDEALTISDTAGGADDFVQNVTLLITRVFHEGFEFLVDGSGHKFVVFLRAHSEISIRCAQF